MYCCPYCPTGELSSNTSKIVVVHRNVMNKIKSVSMEKTSEASETNGESSKEKNQVASTESNRTTPSTVAAFKKGNNEGKKESEELKFSLVSFMWRRSWLYRDSKTKVKCC